MIPLKKAIETYNSPKPAGFWNFLAEKALQIEKTTTFPALLKKLLLQKFQEQKQKSSQTNSRKKNFFQKLNKC